MEAADLARVANNWSMNTDTMGVYGNYYLKRAIVAQMGLGQLAEDAIYPQNLADETGKPLDGVNQYTIHFDKGARHPSRLLVHHPLRLGRLPGRKRLNRFALSSWMPFKYNADGSLDLYFQNDSPGKDKKPTGFPRRKDHSI